MGNELKTIFWKEDYKNKLEDMIMKEEKTIEYLNNIISYFQENKIEKYKKFDKRDLNKIIKYLEEKMTTYYKDCSNNFSIHCTENVCGKTLYIYINNEQQYNCDIDIYTKHLMGDIEFHNVIEQAKNRLDYVKARYEENKNILENFDTYLKQYNDKVREFKDFIDATHLNNIVDIYIYAGKESD